MRGVTCMAATIDGQQADTAQLFATLTIKRGQLDDAPLAHLALLSRSGTTIILAGKQVNSAVLAD